MKCITKEEFVVKIKRFENKVYSALFSNDLYLPSMLATNKDSLAVIVGESILDFVVDGQLDYEETFDLTMDMGIREQLFTETGIPYGILKISNTTYDDAESIIDSIMDSISLKIDFLENYILGNLGLSRNQFIDFLESKKNNPEISGYISYLRNIDHEIPFPKWASLMVELCAELKKLK